MLARQFGIVFALSNELRPLYAGFGINCRDDNGDDGVILERTLRSTIGSVSNRTLPWLGFGDMRMPTKNWHRAGKGNQCTVPR